jgi:acyl-CoA synthetase (NDP forming)
MGFPVVLKVVSPHIIHKTEVGGEVLSSLSQRQKKPILCGAMGGDYTKRISQAIEAEGVPVYHSVREWMAAAKGLAHRKREKEQEI